jgi:hypothetical protein
LRSANPSGLSQQADQLNSQAQKLSDAASKARREDNQQYARSLDSQAALLRRRASDLQSLSGQAKSAQNQAVVEEDRGRARQINTATEGIAKQTREMRQNHDSLVQQGNAEQYRKLSEALQGDARDYRDKASEALKAGRTQVYLAYGRHVSELDSQASEAGRIARDIEWQVAQKGSGSIPREPLKEYIDDAEKTVDNTQIPPLGRGVYRGITGKKAPRGLGTGGEYGEEALEHTEDVLEGITPNGIADHIKNKIGPKIVEHIEDPRAEPPRTDGSGGTGSTPPPRWLVSPGVDSPPSVPLLPGSRFDEQPLQTPGSRFDDPSPGRSKFDPPPSTSMEPSKEPGWFDRFTGIFGGGKAARPKPSPTPTPMPQPVDQFDPRKGSRFDP